jgi:NodT family efflux transporter outer membrane factor (OMF) lipoprotein
MPNNFSVHILRGKINRPGRSGLTLACLLLVAGCSFAPEYVKPSIQTPAAFKEQAPEPNQETVSWKIAKPKDDLIRGDWWKMFQEPDLNALEDQVIVSNQSIAMALANFLAARALVKQAQSQYFPTVTANPAVTRSRQLPLPTPANPSPAPTTLNQFSLPIDASWELDLWGRVRNTVKANALESQATLADLQNVQLTVQAEVAADYFQLSVLDAQKQLLDATVSAYEESFKLTQIQDETGLASGQDIELATTQLSLARAQAIDLGIQRAQLEHALATLLGKPASLFSLATHSLSANPIAVPFSVPSKLLERRPDIAAAERRVAAANAQIGVARAAYFPALTLGGSVGFLSSSLGDLISGPSLVWSVGASLAQTLFDGGKSPAVTDQAWALYQGTVANYRQTVLTAFQDVEDNLSALRILSQELQQQNAAVASSQRYLNLANSRYQSGVDTYLNVITAQTLLLNNQRTELNLQMQQMTASVQLIKALGGGWEGGSFVRANPPNNITGIVGDQQGAIGQ